MLTPCLSCINNSYADRDSGYNTSTGSAKIYNIYIVKGVTYKPISTKERVATSTRTPRTIFVVPFEAVAAHLTDPVKIAALRAEYESGNEAYYQRLAESRSRARGDDDAPPPRQVQLPNRPAGSCFGIRVKCTVPNCLRSAHYRVPGGRCGEHVVNEFGEPIDNVEGAWLLSIPDTEHTGVAYKIREGVYVITNPVFVFHGHAVEGSDQWKKLVQQWKSGVKLSKACAEAAKLLRQQSNLRTGPQKAASAEFIARNVPPAITGLFPEFDSSNSVCHSSKGKKKDVNDSRSRLCMEKGEELRHLIDKRSCPLFLVPLLTENSLGEHIPIVDDEGRALGRALVSSDFFGNGLLAGTWAMWYSDICTEQEALDVEKGHHELMKVLPGTLVGNIGGGQRFGRKEGEFLAAAFCGIGWMKMVEDGVLGLNKDMRAKKLEGFLSNFGLNSRDHVLQPDFDNHLRFREYLRKRDRARRLRKKMEEEDEVEDFLDQLLLGDPSEDDHLDYEEDDIVIVDMESKMPANAPRGSNGNAVVESALCDSNGKSTSATVESSSSGYNLDRSSDVKTPAVHMNKASTLVSNEKTPVLPRKLTTSDSIKTPADTTGMNPADFTINDSPTDVMDEEFDKPDKPASAKTIHASMTASVAKAKKPESCTSTEHKKDNGEFPPEKKRRNNDIFAYFSKKQK